MIININNTKKKIKVNNILVVGVIFYIFSWEVLGQPGMKRCGEFGKSCSRMLRFLKTWTAVGWVVIIIWL